MWIVVMLLMSPVYVGLIVGGRVAMKRGRDNDRPGFRALGVGLVGSGVLLIVLCLLSYPILGVGLTTVSE